MGKTVLVIGAHGYLGKRVHAALAELDGLVVAGGSRRGPVVIDLTRPESFAAMDGFDVVINCSDTIEAPPAEAAKHCLIHGILFVETGAHAPALRALMDLRRAYTDAQGAVVVGVGLFPGVSNLLAHALRDAPGACERIELGIAIRAASGAGKGIANLMVDGFGATAASYVDGQLQHAPALQAGPVLPFPSRDRACLSFDFPETSMLHLTTDVPNLAGYYAPLPRLLRPFVRLSVWLRPNKSGRLQRAYDWLTLGGIRLLRGALFRWRSSRVEIVAIANRGTPSETRGTLVVNDAIGATAIAIAAATVILCVRTRPPTGVLGVGEVFDLDSLLARMRGWDIDVELAIETESRALDRLDRKSA